MAIALKIVSGSSVEEIDVSAIRDRVLDAEVVREKGKTFEFLYGRNAYSNFLITNGRYPDPKQATAIGILIGRRVRDCNGHLQPKLTKQELVLRRDTKRRREQEFQQEQRVNKFRAAIAALKELSSLNQIDSAGADFTIESETSDYLPSVISFLNRFVREK